MKYGITGKKGMAALAVFLIAAGLISCSDSDVTKPESSAGEGTLRVMLVDAPAQIDDIDSLIVEFEEVMVHRSEDADTTDDSGWIKVLSDTLPAEARTFNLLELVNGVFATLGEVDLEAGTYTQIRIMLEDAELYIGGESQDLFIPSGKQTGIKLVDAFTIESGLITELTVDFDVARSLHEAPPGSGNFILRPTIRLVQNILSGTISGTVTPTGIGAVVYALEPFTMDTVTTTMPDSLTGEYVLQALYQGSYNVRASAPGYQDSTITGVIVNTGVDTGEVDFDLIPISQ